MSKALLPASFPNAPEGIVVGQRVYVPQLGIFASVVEITPGHDCQRVRVHIGAAEWFDTTDVALGIRA